MSKMAQLLENRMAQAKELTKDLERIIKDERTAPKVRAEAEGLIKEQERLDCEMSIVARSLRLREKCLTVLANYKRALLEADKLSKDIKLLDADKKFCELRYGGEGEGNGGDRKE